MIIKFYNNILKIKKFKFRSESLENSIMEWNHNGIGKLKIIEENSKNNNKKIYFDEIITLEDGMELKDKKMWEILENKVKFYHYRNENYENIFTFFQLGNKFILDKKYICSPDNYKGNLEIDEINKKIYFTIEIVGKYKNEKIEYIYEF